MAVRTLQLRLVFTVGLLIGPVSAITGSNRAISVEPPPLSAVVDTSPKHNVSLRFLKEPEDVVTVRGQNVTLRCAAESSTGNVTITWLYEDNPLPAGDGRWQINGSNLRVLNVVGGQATKGKTNAGSYGCLASNNYGSIMSKIAKVEVAIIDREVTVSGVDLTYESQPAILQCNVRSNPPADVQWTFNHLPLSNDKRYVPLPNGTLLIRNTKLTDSGNYRCIANNVILGKTRTSKDYHLKVISKPETSSLPALYILTTSNKIVLKGDTIELMCIAIGWPIPTVQWINNRNVTLNNSSTLIIRNAQPKNSGNYTCVAENSVGKTVRIFQLQVYQKPQFNVTPDSKVSPSAQTVRVDCQAKGIPPPRITWLKNGKPWTLDVRIKKVWNGLVFIHSMSTDSGIYQCVASNPAGRISAAVQIEINSSQSPSPPQKVRCRPFDDDKICVSWTPPTNVTNITAYSIYSSFIDKKDGHEQFGPESLELNNTFKLVSGLKYSTNYTFFVRLYSKHASDYSTKVTCQTGVKGFRNLDIETLSSTSVILKWDSLSSDTLCNGTQDQYVVEWFRDDDPEHVISRMTTRRTFTVTELLPTVDYQFRVITHTFPRDEPWTMYSIPDYQSTENDTIDLSNELKAPDYVHEDSVTSTSIRLSWDRVPTAKYYTVCYGPLNVMEGQCDEQELIKSYSPKLSISKLTPNTQYQVMVRAHDYKNTPGVWSQPLNISTLGEVPSAVIGLDYAPLNASTVCVHWRAPEKRNGIVKQYKVYYTTDRNWSLENLLEFNVSADANKEQNCKENHTGLVSTFLTNLSERKYMVMVLAVNEVGLGKPCAPITVNTFGTDDKNSEEMLNGSEAIDDNQRIGIILGVALAGLSIVCCATIILLRRRCLKRQARRRAHAAMSSNLRPAVAHYSSHLGAVQVSLEQLRQVDEHEIEHLVPEERSIHIPPVTPDHLDTKGSSNFPNGCVNGLRKHTKLNGNGVNGAVHITENPQFYAFECNGNLAKNKSEPLLRRYEEDSNSNVKPIDVLFKFFDGLNEYKNDSCKSKSDESCHEAGLNCTQLTLLDDSHRKLSPVLEPNG